LLETGENPVLFRSCEVEEQISPRGNH